MITNYFHFYHTIISRLRYRIEQLGVEQAHMGIIGLCITGHHSTDPSLSFTQTVWKLAWTTLSENPTCFAPGLQRDVNRIADVERGCLGCSELKHVAEVELQPALQERLQSAS